MKSVKPRPEVEKFMGAILEASKEHAADLSAQEMLAVYSKLAGRTLAMLDQRKFTADMGITILRVNVEVGNAEVLAEVMKTGDQRPS